jgi:hypothetical protein
MGTGKRRINSAVRVLLIALEAELEIDPVLAEPEHVQVLAELEHDPVAVELGHAPVVAEREHDLVAAELELAQVEVELVPVPGQPRAQLAVALKIKSVTGVPRRDLVLIVAVALAAAAETTRVPAATEAVVAWAVADTAVAVVAEDAVAEE